jgi:hypothetical protein
VLTFVLCAVMALVLGDDWKHRVRGFVGLLILCGIIFWTEQEDAELRVNGDLHRIENSRHMPLPDRWWRMQ